MKYISTRQAAPEVDLSDVILNGLAPDGGLYVPKHRVRFTPEDLARLRQANYDTLAFEILSRFCGDAISHADLQRIVDKACGAWRHPSIAPLVEIAPQQWIMELFHGPTLAFKDHALQVLAPMLDHFLTELNREAFVLCATSGDTGGAALAALSGLERVKALVLYPQNGVSAFQERQMLDLASERCQVLAVEGTFDDCQRIVKTLLADRPFATRYALTAVNSVNWARIMAQTVYYAKAALMLSSETGPVTFVVPTGNFGNAYAGVLARHMGFPVGRVVVATNENDTLVRALDDGVYAPKKVKATNTPAMDIQNPSNFERMVFDADTAEDKHQAAAFLDRLKQSGQAKLSKALRKELSKTLGACCTSIRNTAAQIAETYRATGYVADPHTSLALAAAAGLDPQPGQTVVLSTAHPAKFAEIVADACEEAAPVSAYHGARVGTPKPARVIAPDSAVVRHIITTMAGGADGWKMTDDEHIS